MKTEKYDEKNPVSDKVERLYEAVRLLLEEGKYPKSQINMILQ